MPSTAIQLQTPLEQINQRERQILVHSYLYYGNNTNIIDDATFTRWTYELVDLMAQYPEDFAQSEFHTTFMGYEGASGVDLNYKGRHTAAVGQWLLTHHKGKE